MTEWSEPAAQAAEKILTAGGKRPDELDEVERLALGALMYGACTALAVRDGQSDIGVIGTALTGALSASLGLEKRTAAEYVRFYTRCTERGFHPALYEIIARGAALSRCIGEPEALAAIVQDTLRSTKRK